MPATPPGGPPINPAASSGGSTQGSVFTPTIVDIGIEVVIVVVLAWVAGLQPEAGTAIIWFLIALWIVFLFSWYKSRNG